jgi:hypothetical protein
MKYFLKTIVTALMLFSMAAAGCGKITTQTTVTTAPAATYTATQTTTSLSTIGSTKDSVVQVWVKDSSGAKTLEALGVPVGDGTTILTIVNYEDYSPGEMEITTQNNGTFTATVQAIDARTGATLLKLASGKLPAVTTRDPATLKTNEPLIIWGQNHSDPIPESTDIIGPVTSPYSPVLAFNVALPESILNGGGWGGAQTQGAVVVDRSGKVLGLESIYTTRLIMRLGYPGYIPPIISIVSAAALLSTDANKQLWANGPLLFAANISASRSGNYDGIDRDYLPVANAITQVLNKLGGPLSISDLPQDFISYAIGNEATNSPDGSLLTTVFPRPVNLYNSAETLLTQAKWVGIQWDRNNGKPGRVVYGNAAYTVEGSFEITGDTSSLENAVKTMLNDPLPYGQ